MTNPEPSGWNWLWDELARRLGPVAAAERATHRGLGWCCEAQLLLAAPVLV